MIGFLKGKVKLIGDNYLVLDVQNVGYKVEKRNGSFLEGQEVELFIYTHVAEKELRLFGFNDERDLKLFELLISVSGVGPKSGMILISEVKTDQILSSIAQNNPETLKTKGIGKKTAEKIIIELENKIDNFGYKVDVSKEGKIESEVYMEVIEAMSALGYRKGEIDAALKNIDLSLHTDSQEIVKKILKSTKK